MKLLPTGISSFSQLRSRNAVYADKYRHNGKPIVAVGISFDTKQKKVGDWRAQAL